MPSETKDAPHAAHDHTQYPHSVFLLIKAETFTQVKEAARRRGLYVPSSTITPHSDTAHEFRARCFTDDRGLLAIQRWLAEEPPVIQGYGFPPGTLLFFRLQD